MTCGIHGPAPLSIDLDPSHLPSPAEASLISLLQLLWQNEAPYAHASIGDSVTGKSLVLPSERVSSPSSPHTFILTRLVQKARIFGRTRIIRTLDPSRIQATGQTSIIISGRPAVRIAGPRVRQAAHLLQYDRRSGTPFPPNTTGYLYFRAAEPNRPRISGELRFRLCTTADEFAIGEDLKRPDGSFWRIPLFVIVRYSSYRPFLEKIVEEGLIPLELADNLLADAGEPVFPSLCSSVLHELSDPFTWDLSSKMFWAATDKGCLQAYWKLNGLREPTTTLTPLYHGAALFLLVLYATLTFVSRSHSCTLRTVAAARARRHTDGRSACS